MPTATVTLGSKGMNRKKFLGLITTLRDENVQIYNRKGKKVTNNVVISSINGREETGCAPYAT